MKNREERAREIKEELKNYYCTEHYYQHSLNRHVVYTDGIRQLAQVANAYWLIDAVASYYGTPMMEQAIENDERLRTLQFWTLVLRQDAGDQALLECKADVKALPIVKQFIEHTDFPLDDFRIWAGWDGIRWVLYLPSEH